MTDYSRYVSTKKFGKVEIYPVVDTVDKDKSALFREDLLVNELNQLNNKCAQVMNENKIFKSILNELGIDLPYYRSLNDLTFDKDYSNINLLDKCPTKFPVSFSIYENPEFVIKEMICTLKNLEGEYSYCKGRLRKIYGSILNYITNGNIIVTAGGDSRNFRCNFRFSPKFKKYDVPKDYEKNPLSKNSHFIPTTHSKPKTNSTKRKRYISGIVRQNVFMRDNYTCQICGKTIDDGITLELDHIKPFSKGGTNDENNLQVLCSQCNLEKHNRTDLLHDKRKLKQLNG